VERVVTPVEVEAVPENPAPKPPVSVQIVSEVTPSVALKVTSEAPTAVIVQLKPSPISIRALGTGTILVVVI
jgi:hypothetical protein